MFLRFCKFIHPTSNSKTKYAQVKLCLISLKVPYIECILVFVCLFVFFVNTLIYELRGVKSDLFKVNT